MSQTAKFDNDRHFEERIVQALIVDHKFGEQMLEVLNLDFFNYDYLKEVTNILFEYHKSYKAFPSFKLLAGIVKKDIESDLLRDQVIAYLLKIRKEPLNGDLEYVKDKSLDFCRRRSLACALEETLDLIEDKRYDEIVPVVQKALVAGQERDVGHNLIDDFDARMVEEVRQPIPTPWQEINDITQGGPSGGDLCCLLAPTGTGKSHFLVDVGHAALNLGCTVAHYTLELGEKNIAHRYDSRFTGFAPERLIDHKEEVREILKQIPGRLVIKSYPTKNATVLTIKSHLHKMIMLDMKPDLIIIDYADLMRSLHHYDQKRLEEESVYEDLSGLGKELNIPIWTATQTNREGLGAEVITMKHVAECFGKAMICDFFLTMARNKESTYTNIGNFFVAKSRLGPDGIKYPIMIDTSLSKIELMSDGGSIDPDDDDPQNVHKKLRKSFFEFQQNGGMGE